MTSVAELLRPDGNLGRWMPEGRTPTTKQYALLALNFKKEILYGGQVGGGKSDGLLMAALQYADIPGYAALLLRKRLTDLKKPGALIPRSYQWLASTEATFNKNDNVWTFPSGATLSFGYIRNDEDVEQYQSAEFQFIGFDELTQFNKYQYTYMMSRLRKPNHGPLANVPLRVRGATNPGGRGPAWVKARFVEVTDERDSRHERAFIQSGLKDNPHIDEVAYRRMLAELDPATRRQLEEGDWDAREPGNWVLEDPAYVDASVAAAEEWIERGLITEPENGRVAGGIDWGESTAAYAIWPIPGGSIYIPPSESVHHHREPGDVSIEIFEDVSKFGFPVSDWRYDAAGVQSMRTFMKTVRNLGDRQNSTKISFSSYKRETMWYLRLLFRRVAQDEATRIILIHPANKELIRQLKVWERKVNREGEDTGETTKVDDHSCDALVAGVAPIARKHRSWVESQVDGHDLKVAA